jgi:pSer/pThr/pTyr-binding forkhead associated (FHA) protein
MSLGGLWNRISTAFERSDIGLPGSAHDDERDDLVRPTATRYAPIRKAVERRVTTFLRDDLVSHLEIGFNEVFLLHYIEVAADGQGAAELEQFLEEFSPEARVRWVKKLLGPAVGKHVSLDQFLGLDKDFPAEALAETDPFEEKLNQAAVALYRVTLHGRWANAAAMHPAAQAQVAADTERLAGPGLRLSVQDAKSPGGSRTVEIEHFPAVLGSSMHADVEISGYYVSTRHCTLHWEAEHLWVADHSTNGTWVDGERVQRGNRVALANGALLGFGRDRGDSEQDRYPALRVHLLRQPVAAGASATPVTPSASTPVAPLASGRTSPVGGVKALAVLAIADATGSPLRDVITLPFTIGRGSSQDYVVPDANEGVSREHLVIEEITPLGAATLNRAVSRNGTFSGNKALPERFTWRFGQEVVLGERWADAPPVCMTLRPVQEKEIA